MAAFVLPDKCSSEGLSDRKLVFGAMVVEIMETSKIWGYLYTSTVCHCSSPAHDAVICSNIVNCGRVGVIVSMIRDLASRIGAIRRRLGAMKFWRTIYALWLGIASRIMESSPMARPTDVPARFHKTMITVMLVVATCAAMVRAQDVPWTRRLVSGSSEGYTRIVYDAAHRVTLLYGGTIGVTGYGAATWTWDGIAWTGKSVAGPSPRSLFAMSYDSWRGVTVLFGGATGTGGETRSNETWEWDGTAWTKRNVPGPPALTGHAMAFDAVRGVTVLVGGGRDGGYMNDHTWEWNGTSWTERSVATPEGRSTAGMAFDSARGVIVLFGGAPGAGSDNGGTWEYDGMLWRQVATDGPPRQNYSAMAYDRLRGVTVLFGGRLQGNIPSADTWEWNGVSWRQRVQPGPPAGYGYAMAYDWYRGRTVLFGGSSGWDTWELGLGSFCIGLEKGPIAQRVCTGETGTFTVQLAGSSPFIYRWQWRPVGGSVWYEVVEGVNADTTIPNCAAQFIASGSGLASVVLRYATGAACPLASTRREVRVIVSNACGSVTSDPTMWTIVTCPCNIADITDASGVGNPDGQLTGSDVVTFFQSFFGVCTGSTPCNPADITDGAGTGAPDGSLTGSDVVSFFQAFFAPCS